jgi:small subunit ribosomal protein S13e
MGRLHSNGKGISGSAIPYSRTPPAWLKTTPDQVVEQICKLAKKGVTPSQIGIVLRDSHGIAQVKVVTGMFIFSGGSGRRKELGSCTSGALTWVCPGAGNRILRILKSNGTVTVP